MSFEELLANRDESTCFFDQKFSFDKVSDTVLKGVYPLQKLDGQTVTYGGEVVTQAVLAAWETVGDKGFSLHSMHGYFVKAGSDKSVIRYEVQTTSQGKNFANKLVNAYQEENNVLIYTVMASFAKDNYHQPKKEAYAKGQTKRIPFEFQSKPHPFFDQYKDSIDDLLAISSAKDLIVNLVPFDFFAPQTDEEKALDIGDRTLGFFGRINDNFSAGKDKEKLKVAGLLYLSDCLHLSLSPRMFGVPVTKDNAMFWRASVDHTLYVHDMDFDPTEPLFLSFGFPRLASGRIIINVKIYNLAGKLISTMVQEALIDLQLAVVKQANGGSYKL